MRTTSEILDRAAAARVQAGLASADSRRAALRYMAEEILAASDTILAANTSDVEAARGTVSDVMIDRLILTGARIQGMAEGIRQVAQLPDPVGIVLDTVERPSGIVVRKVSVPFGVLAIIYESRPNVTSDAAALAVMSGNCCILRCGKEAWNSAKAIVDAIQAGLRRAGLPEDMVQLIEDRTRQSSHDLMTAVGRVDLLIPRGGAGLINACVRDALVPCIQTGTGICHIYVDGQADQDMALNIIENAKTSRPSVCNAAEVCVVDRSIAAEFLPRLRQRLVEDRIAAGKQPVEFRCDPEAQAIMNGTPASENDFDTEFLDYIMAVKVVSGVEEAVAHIGAHSTHHSDAIVTADPQAADLFVKTVDSAAVYVNASTRFTDGGEFGLGCEMGISTQKMHARGPMGLRELTTYKYIVTGEGQIR